MGNAEAQTFDVKGDLFLVSTITPLELDGYDPVEGIDVGPCFVGLEEETGRSLVEVMNRL